MTLGQSLQGARALHVPAAAGGASAAWEPRTTGTIPVLGRGEQVGDRLHLATKKSVQFIISELFISRIFHLMF